MVVANTSTFILFRACNLGLICSSPIVSKLVHYVFCFATVKIGYFFNYFFILRDRICIYLMHCISLVAESPSKAPTTTPSLRPTLEPTMQPSFGPSSKPSSYTQFFSKVRFFRYHITYVNTAFLCLSLLCCI